MLYNFWHGFKNKLQNTIKVYKQKTSKLYQPR